MVPAFCSVLSASPAGTEYCTSRELLPCCVVTCAGVATAEISGVVETAPHFPLCLLERATGHPEKEFIELRRKGFLSPQVSWSWEQSLAGICLIGLGQGGTWSPGPVLWVVVGQHARGKGHEVEVI